MLDFSEVISFNKMLDEFGKTGLSSQAITDIGTFKIAPGYDELAKWNIYLEGQILLTCFLNSGKEDVSPAVSCNDTISQIMHLLYEWDQNLRVPLYYTPELRVVTTGKGYNYIASIENYSEDYCVVKIDGEAYCIIAPFQNNQCSWYGILNDEGGKYVIDKISDGDFKTEFIDQHLLETDEPENVTPEEKKKEPKQISFDDCVL